MSYDLQWSHLKSYKSLCNYERGTILLFDIGIIEFLKLLICRKNRPIFQCITK